MSPNQVKWLLPYDTSQHQMARHLAGTVSGDLLSDSGLMRLKVRVLGGWSGTQRISYSSWREFGGKDAEFLADRS